jgi:hypothetical protein
MRHVGEMPVELGMVSAQSLANFGNDQTKFARKLKHKLGDFKG